MQDINTFSAQERLLLVHAAYGKAMLRAHRLEHTLVSLLICHDASLPERKLTWRSNINKLKRLPLGPLIEKFVEVFSPSDELTEELENLLYFRNELTHRISDIIINAASQSNWEEKVIKELEEINSYFFAIDIPLQSYINTFYTKLDITEAKILELMHMFYPGVTSRLPLQ